tara:strand:- start:401 stop:1207 length:807 start_codon:yes stop_codon:yes gene_type:complete
MDLSKSKIIKNVILNKSSEKMDEIPDDSIRLIVTSPPYYNAKDYQTNNQIGIKSPSYEHYLESMIPIWKECFRILRPNGKLCINSPILPMKKTIMNTHHNRDYLNINNDIEHTILSNTNLFRYDLIIWDKGPTDQLMMGSYPYPPNFYGMNTIEFINIFVKDGPPEIIEKDEKDKSKLSKNEWRKYIDSIWRFPPEKNRSHPAPFPIDLPYRLIKLFSFKGDTIVDPFMGSGTTALASVKCGRNYIGYELNKDYIELSFGRLRQVNIF